MLFREIITVYCENNMDHISALCSFNVKIIGTYTRS
jgi:hypothetical protein